MVTETDYITATNLAKIRIAYQAMKDTLAGYGPLTESRWNNIVGLLSDLLDECFETMNGEVLDSKER